MTEVILSFNLQEEENFGYFGRFKMASKNPLKTYEVQIGDCSLRLKSSHNSTTLQEIVQVVEKQIRSSKTHNRTLSIQKTFALCCLNVAEELVCLKQALRRQMDQLESSTQSVFSELKSSSTSVAK